MALSHSARRPASGAAFPNRSRAAAEGSARRLPVPWEICGVTDREAVRELQQLLDRIAPGLLKKGITPRLVGAIAADSFVRAAALSSLLGNGRVNVSCVAVVTGLSRPEVGRILRGERTIGKTSDARTIRVIRGWLEDGDFSTRARGPRVLQYAGEKGSFVALARKYAGDVPPSAVLKELRRAQLAKRTVNAGVALRSRWGAARSKCAAL